MPHLLVGREILRALNQCGPLVCDCLEESEVSQGVSGWIWKEIAVQGIALTSDLGNCPLAHCAGVGQDG